MRREGGAEEDLDSSSEVSFSEIPHFNRRFSGIHIIRKERGKRGFS